MTAFATPSRQVSRVGGVSVTFGTQSGILHSHSVASDTVTVHRVEDNDDVAAAIGATLSKDTVSSVNTGASRGGSVAGATSEPLSATAVPMSVRPALTIASVRTKKVLDLSKSDAPKVAGKSNWSSTAGIGIGLPMAKQVMLRVA